MRSFEVDNRGRNGYQVSVEFLTSEAIEYCSGEIQRPPTSSHRPNGSTVFQIKGIGSWQGHMQIVSGNIRYQIGCRHQKLILTD